MMDVFNIFYTSFACIMEKIFYIIRSRYASNDTLAYFLHSYILQPAKRILWEESTKNSQFCNTNNTNNSFTFYCLNKNNIHKQISNE